MKSVRPRRSYVSFKSIAPHGAGPRTVRGQVAHGIGPVLLIFTLAVILAQLTGKMPQDGIALDEDLVIELDDGYRGSWVHVGDLRLLVLWIFLEGVSNVFVGDPGILCK